MKFPKVCLHCHGTGLRDKTELRPVHNPFFTYSEMVTTKQHCPKCEGTGKELEDEG